MKILVANRHLKGLGGSETFTYTLINELQKQGYEVEYFTLYKGIASEKIEALGVKYATGVNYDLIITGQVDTVTELRKQQFTGPIIQICHGAVTPGEQPHPEADGYIAISEEVRENIRKQTGKDSPVILNGIDCNRFKPVKRLRKKLKRIASLVQTDEAHKMVEEAAHQLGVEVIRLNKYQDKVWDVASEMNKADLVVSLGRGCYEAMACGRPVVVFDKRRYQESLADGYLTSENFEKFAKNNCSGRSQKISFTVNDLVSEFQKYNPEDGNELRKIALEKLNIEIQTKKILASCQLYVDAYTYPGTVDLVYILGKGSTWGNNEIRLSIRSFVQHFNNLRNVVVVGECPEFLRGVIHIPYPDRQGVNKDARMMLKILAACKDSRVSENFILCTDDTALLCDLHFEDFKGWHEGPIMYNAVADLEDHKHYAPNPETREPSDWFNFVYDTGTELKKRNLPDNNYDKAHSPQPINKAEFIEVLASWDMINNHYTISNIYNNSTKLFPGENIKGRNLKVYGEVTSERMDELINEKTCLNYNDNALDETLKAWLYKTFSDPTKYELFFNGDDRRKAAQEWFRKGCNYDDGLALIKHFAPKNRHLIRYFELKHNNEFADKKLKKTLELWLR